MRFVGADNPHATERTADILAAVAADEARRTAERTRAALAVKKARGHVHGRPNNFSAAGRSLGTYVDAAPSLHAVARSLETADVPTPAGGYAWHPTTVARVVARLAL